MHQKKIFKTLAKWAIPPILLLCILAAGGWLLLYLAFPPHDPDAVMLRNFHENRATFENILVRLQEDEDIRRVDDNWYELADGEFRNDTPARIVQYRKLFKNISTERGISVSSSPSGRKRVVFYSNCIGLVTGGSSKGYVYDPHPESDVIMVDSIDDYDPHKDIDRSYWWVYRKIEGCDGWYLYCDFAS